MKISVNLDNQDNLIIQNYIMRKDNSSESGNNITKIGGTHRYNTEALPQKIRWVDRYYGLKADGSFVKRTFCFSDGSIYLGDDVAKTLTEVYSGLTKDCNPESVVMQVTGNSREYLFTGYDTPLYYEGNDSGQWTQSQITYRFVQGVVKDNRLWGFERNSSILYFSRALYPEDFAITYGGSIVCGNDKDSFIRRVMILGDYIYVFKNNEIGVIRGNTQSTYRYEVLIPDVGLLAQKAAANVSTAIVFVSQQDRQVYQFGGSWNIRRLSGIDTNNNFAEEIDEIKSDDICMGWDRHQNLCRISYKSMDADETYNNYEAIFPTNDMGSDKKPKWAYTYGARVSCYSMWNRQGDYELVTGRSDTGLLMYHNRGSDFDDVAIETILRTDNTIGRKGYNSKWNSLFLRGTPSSGSITLYTYLNARLTLGGTKSTQTMSDLGEESGLESITFKTQADFNNWIPLLTGYNYGEALSVELYDNTKGKQISLEEIILDFTPRAEVRNSLVG